MDYMTAKDIAKSLGVQRSTAEKILQRLNKELKEKGYLTVAGRVSKRYFKERYR